MATSVKTLFCAHILSPSTTLITTTESRRRRAHSRSRCLLLRRCRKRTLLGSTLLLVLPLFQRLVGLSLRRSRRFWSAPRGGGFWEMEVCYHWKSVGRHFPDWEETQYTLLCPFNRGVLCREVAIKSCTVSDNFLAKSDSKYNKCVCVCVCVCVCYWEVK